MAEVFISYARTDQGFARDLNVALQKLSRDTWIDWRSIPDSAERRAEIFAGIEQADNFVFLISPDSVKSWMCGQEVSHAVANNKRLITILYHSVEHKDLLPALAEIQWIDYPSLGFQQTFERLISAIDTDFEWVRKHTQFLVRATEWESKDRDQGFLLHGMELKEAVHWLEQAATIKGRTPTEVQERYIRASEEWEAGEIQRLRELTEEKERQRQEAERQQLIATAESSSPKLLDPPAVAEIRTLTCSGCGKTGVSICARCSKKPGYKTALARAHPLQERDPELYKRLDEMSRLSPQENKPFWDEFCIEIKAEDNYEALSTFVEILQEGKWRTDALNVRPWLRKNLAKRVKRFSAPEDYGPMGKRLPSRRRFDRRSGALTAFSTRPFTEFAVVHSDKDDISPEDHIEHLTLGQRDEDDRGAWMPADRESLKFLGGRTYAEKFESQNCSRMVYALRHDRSAFNKELARAITEQQALANTLGLDRDEAEVLAVMSLLWDAGPRMYLNFLGGAEKKRTRNAWDRLDRLRKQERFHRALRDIALRRRPEHQGADPHTAGVSQQEKAADPPFRDEHYLEFRDIEERQEETRRNQFMQRFLDWLAATGVNAATPTDRPKRTRGVVDLPCDLAPKERLNYQAASGKGPTSAMHKKLYSD